MPELRLRSAYTAAGATSVQNLAATMGVPPGSLRRFLQFANLHNTYLATGAAEGKLGWPRSDASQRADGAVTRGFEGGTVLVARDGATTFVPEISWTVHFVGLECMRESSHDQSSNSDEPYVVWSVQSGAVGTPSARKHFNNIDTGSKRAVTDSSISGPVNQLGIPFVISAFIWESDAGQGPAVEQAVNDGFNDALQVYNDTAKVVNLFAGAAVMPPLPGPVDLGKLAKGVGKLLGLEDDYVGENSVLVFGLERETNEQQAARIRRPLPTKQFKGQTYTHSFEVVGNPEGRYTLYFRLDMVRDQNNEPIPL